MRFVPPAPPLRSPDPRPPAAGPAPGPPRAAFFPEPAVRFDASSPAWPARLDDFAPRYGAVDVCGSLDAERVVAIVGSRHPTRESRDYAYSLALELARRGVVVASGGAFGVDLAAHEGALEAGGRTWAFLPGAFPTSAPASHAPLYERIAASDGSVVWTGGQPDLRRAWPSYLERNRALVFAADAVVVIQAAIKSGSRNSAKWARELGRALWVVTPSPWLDRELYAGNLLELAGGYARPLFDNLDLFDSLHLAPELAPTVELAQDNAELDNRDDAVELAIVRLLRAVAPVALHVDEIGTKTGLSHASAASALLTLCLEAVVVEGPGGFYRRRLIRSSAPAALAAGRDGRHRETRSRGEACDGQRSLTGSGFERDGGR